MIMKPIKIAVLGGTGKAGKFLVTTLLNSGFEIRLLIRNPEHLPFKNPLMDVITGNANSYQDIKSLLTGCDAIISTLGLGIPNSESSIFSTATTNILAAMQELEINRYIVITGLNVATPQDTKNPAVQAATDWMKTHYPETTADKQQEYAILSQSEADWTLVRLPLIELTDEITETRVSTQDCSGTMIGAKNLALFLIAQLTDTQYHRKAPFIANV